jgi:hypothetical protein
MREVNVKQPIARSVAFLFVGMVVGALVVPPAAAHISNSFAHLWGDHIKEKADKRYTGDTKIVVTEKITVEDGDFGGRELFCPSDYEAISGGIEGGNVLDWSVTASGPIFGEQGNHKRLWAKRAGTYGSAQGWLAYIRNNAGGESTARVAVVCAKR